MCGRPPTYSLPGVTRSDLRRSIGHFLLQLFRAGAFQGTTDREAYFVRCDVTSLTRTDTDRGRVNVEIGVALLKPAEFIILRRVLKTATAPA